MVRRTKEEAQVTRSRILDAAEHVFERHGVSGTSLNDIAEAAGVTRGAIYWHFRDKADLFNAMMERVTLPLEESSRIGGAKSAALDIAQMRCSFIDVLHKIVADAQLKRVFGIATHKVEYVGELTAVRERHIDARDACLVDVERTFKRALRHGELARGTSTRAAAIGLHALFDGLLQNWMLDPRGFDLVRVGTKVLDTYLTGLARPAVATQAPHTPKHTPTRPSGLPVETSRSLTS
jgi:TetR/AcrR family acrAB operon transcriptional repressor